MFVESMTEADLVIFTNVRDIEREYDKEKSYAYLELGDGARGLQLPDNCTTVDQSNLLVGLIHVITITSQKLDPIVEVVHPIVEEVVPIRADALRILVIDDTPKNITSAKQSLTGHRLTTVTRYEDAMEVLGSL